MENKIEMVKVVYNEEHGAFGLSEMALGLYEEISGKCIHARSSIYQLNRSDPFLVQVVEALGVEANAEDASLAIRELPKGTKYRIDEYDGSERIVTIDEDNWRIA